MKKIILGLAICYAAGSAQAQSFGPIPAFEAVTIARSMGLRPLGPPMRRGPTYVLRAINPYDVVMRVVIDARHGEVLAAVPLDPAAPPSPPPFDADHAADFRGFPGAPDGAPGFGEFGDEELALREVPAQPPKIIRAPREGRSRTALPAPARPPVPRPRPAATTIGAAPAAASQAQIQPERKIAPQLAPTPPASAIPVNPLE